MTHRKEISSFQEGIRRYQNALDGIADRIPVCAQLNEFAMQEIGADAKEFYTMPNYWLRQHLLRLPGVLNITLKPVEKRGGLYYTFATWVPRHPRRM